jgi:amino acid adenylation domain-containing protein
MGDLKNAREHLSPAKRALLEKRLQHNVSGKMQAIPRRTSPDLPAPLSFAQQRLWFLDQYCPGSSAYNVPRAVRLRGPLKCDALQHALNAVVARHEVLRTVFHSEQGTPAQVVRPAAAVQIGRADLTGCTDPEQAALEAATVEARKPFDLTADLMLRATLLRVQEDDHILVLVTHHIASDGWSRWILFHDLAVLYAAACAGRDPELPELPIQYADFAAWQREWLEGARLQKQLSYWKQQLAGIPALLELPADYPRPAVASYRGAKFFTHYSAELAAAIKELGQREGATVFMTLLAAFQVLLHRYSRQDDIAVGTPVAGRRHPQTESLIGDFVNMLVLRSDHSGNPTFRELLARVRRVALDAYDHQDIPFEKLVEELEKGRDLSRAPLFQVMFALENTGGGLLQFEGLETSTVELDTGVAKNDLIVSVKEEHQGLKVKFEYSTDLFDKVTIERMAGHFGTLLAAITANPGCRVLDLPLLTAEEEHLLLVEWNRTTRDYPHSRRVHQLIEAQAERTPHAPAVVFGDERLTYRHLNERANQLAYFLLRQGAGAGKRIGIYLERSPEMLVALLAAQKTGGAYVPLDPAYPAERIRLTLEEAQVCMVVSREPLVPSLPAQCAPTVCLDRDEKCIATESRGNPSVHAGANDVMYVIFTSGSTGRPKGVQVSHGSVVNLLSCMAREWQLGAQDVFPALASYAFDMSVPELYLALLSGGCVALGEHWLAADGVALARWLRAVQATIVHATPTTWKLLLEAGFDGKGLKRAIGAEPVPQELCDRLLAADASLYNFYGPTETTVWSTVHHMQRPGEAVTVGRPLDNTQIYILDSQGRPVPIGVPGEICIGGEGVALGYLNRPDLTAEKFVADSFTGQTGRKIYRTGDLGRYRNDGTIQFLGRADFQVKIRGFRIELGEIETALGRHPDVRQNVVLAREDTPGDKRLVAYVVARDGASLDASDLRRHLRSRLPDYMVPSRFVVLEALPLSPNGKVDRRALPSPEAGGLPEKAAAIEPTTDFEKQLADIWAQVLKVHLISMDDNFFELGGHSLLATQVVARIREQFGVELSPRALFEAPTLQQMSEVIGETMLEQAEPQALDALLNGLGAAAGRRQ